MVAKELGYLVEGFKRNSPTARPNGRSVPNAGSVCASNLNMRAGISAITAILEVVAT
jgi:hypothetical protein